MRRNALVAIAGLLFGAHALAAGSWTQQVPGPRITIPERTVEVPLSPPASATVSGRHITRVRWQFDHDSFPERFATWLCHQEECIEVEPPFGLSDALHGKPAENALTFRFRRLTPHGPPIQIRRLQVIVDYR